MARGLKYGGRTIAVLGVVLLLFVVYQLWGTSIQYAQAQSGLRDDFSFLLAQTAAFRDGKVSSANLGDSAGADFSLEGTGRIATLSSDTATLSSGTAMLSTRTAQLSSGTTQLRAVSALADLYEASAQTLAADGLVHSGSSGAAPAESADAGTETAAAGSEAARASSPATSFSGTSSQGAVAPPSETSDAGANEAALPKTLLVSPSTRLPREDIENADLVYTPGAEEILPLLYPGDGKAVARIVIPTIKMDEIVVEGTDEDALRKGPGHYSWTPMPGQPGNASIAGHRTTYGAPFANIGNLRPGDRITMQTAQGEFIYEVLPQDLPTKGYLIVSPDRVDLLRDKGDNLLTLTSCHPRFSSRQRIVVQAKLLGYPVVPMRNLNARQDAPQELVSEDLTGVASETRSVDEAGAGGETRTSEISAISEGGAAGNVARDVSGGRDAASKANPSDDGRNIAQQGGSISGTGRANSASGANNASGTGGALGLNAASESSTSGSSGTGHPVGAGFGDGLSGERSAIPSAMLWFIATAILWAAVWLVGTRWRRMPSIAIGILPVLGCLFIAFSYLDRALPAY